MSINKYRTLTGFTVESALIKLDEELPADAYKSAGVSWLTDINPAYMRAALTEVFGLCGVGWGYSYNPQNLVVDRSDAKTTVAFITHGIFWYVLVNEDDSCLKQTIETNGGSKNNNPEYALKGAVTNMIGHAVSNIGFQESVYKGIRDHKNVGKTTAKKPAAKPIATKPVATKTAAKPATKAKPEPQPEPIPELEEICPDFQDGGEKSPADYVIEISKHKGKRLGDLPDKAVDWYANKMKPTSPAAKSLQKMAQKLIAMNS
ncbi:MAG: hypothetical protein JEZ06_08905 [Anaerolineaceae bacterium]|nr:hypothetical protein [Anaerolineaceae bacterium]